MLTTPWKQTMDAAVKDPRAAAYDATIAAEAAEYQRRLGITPGWQTLPLRLFRAMVLVESGGPASPAWTTAPAQIGANARDPGYAVLRAGGEWSMLIMSPALRQAIATQPIRTGALNVRAAIALVLTKAVRVVTVSQVNPADPQLRQHTLGRNDSFDRIRRTERTTMDDLKASNPGVKPTAMHPGQVVNFHGASMQPQVIGWQAITASFLAQKYNGGGDPAYAEKLSYVLGLLK